MSLITYIYDVVINRIHIPHNEAYKVVSDAFNESSIMKDQVKKNRVLLHMEWYYKINQ